VWSAQSLSGEIKGEQLEQLRNLRKQLLTFQENPAALEEVTGSTLLKLQITFNEAIEQLKANKP
jgi:hypothetical protein